MLPFILVWAFYFLWRGFRNGHLREFFATGLIGGIGFYTYFSFRIVPLMALILFWNYWSYLKKDFTHTKYEYAKSQLLRGFAIMMLATIIVALPLGLYFLNHPEDFLKREGRPISVFEQKEPPKELGFSIVKTLGMFNFAGDYNQRHNIPGWPQLSLPIGVLFAVGFLRELIHWLKRKHGHFSTVHTLLFGWFFIMLTPGFLSTEAPHALRAIGVIPVVMLFAAKGFLWLVNLVLELHKTTDPHLHFNKPIHLREKHLLITLTVIAFMTSIGFFEYSRYFKAWAEQSLIKEAFAQKLVNISKYLNHSDPLLLKYILVNEGDVTVDGVPNNAQTIKFLTQTHTQERSDKKKIFYIKDEELSSLSSLGLKQKLMLVPLSDSPELEQLLKKELNLIPNKKQTFTVYSR